MTRETKIGLLVGLAFIIVIGILLSDHLTSSSEPALAPLVQAGDSVRESVRMPGTGEAPAPVVSPVAVSPPQPVMTRQELIEPVQPPVQIVKIGSPAQGQPQQPMSIQVAPGTAPQQPNAPVTSFPQIVDTGEEVVGADPPPVITRTPVATSTDPLGQIAQQHGEALELTDGSRQQPTQVTVAPTGAAAPLAGEYVAQPGDTLSKMAGRFMGGNTKANRDAIVRANPSLKADPNKIIAGRTYMIPVPANAAPQGQALAPSPAPVAPAQPAVSSQPEYWYTVKEGDNLWKIAESQLGDGTAYTAIKELNKDTLKGGETVTPNMKLRLPARPIASAN